MKRASKLFASLLLVAASSTASAWWGNDGWGSGWNTWPVWTPMYWAEEMFGDDNDWYGPYGHRPYGYGAPYGYGGYGYPYPYPYPYGGAPYYPGGAPFGGYGAPYGGYGVPFYGAPWRY